MLTIKLWEFANFCMKEIYYRIEDFYGFGFQRRNLANWAVVTGGTDGIGKAYADELAARGFDICLISRNKEKLTSVAEELEKKYDVSTKVIYIDFTGGPEIYKVIGTHLEELDGGIGVLVNNVGMSYKCPEYFHAVPNGLQVMGDMINSNVTSCTMMMRLVIPMMGNEGAVINISSLTALYPMPLLAIYSACKVYVDFLSRAVQHEFKDTGLIIQCVLPAYVATKMSNRRQCLEIPSAKTFVSSAIKTIGVENYTCGYLPHKIRGSIHKWLKDNMPACINCAIAMYFMKQMRERYNRRLKKKNAEPIAKQKEISELKSPKSHG